MLTCLQTFTNWLPSGTETMQIFFKVKVVPCYYKQNLSTFTLKGNSIHFHYVPHFSVSLPHSQKLVTADKLVPSMGVHGDCANEQ